MHSSRLTTFKAPVRKSVGQAFTTVFGSVCLASLLIAIIQTLRQIARAMTSENPDNPVVAIVSCCCQFFLAYLEAWARFLNSFCLIICAVYGCPFSPASRQVNDMLSTPGGFFETVVNYDLTGIVSFMGNLMAGSLACG